jgi:hypothetical protein
VQQLRKSVCKRCGIKTAYKIKTWKIKHLKNDATRIRGLRQPKLFPIIGKDQIKMIDIFSKKNYL